MESSVNNQTITESNSDLFSITSIDDLIRLYYTFVYPYWMLYVIIPVIFVVAAIFFVQTTPKRYEGTCTFNIQAESISFSGVKSGYNALENTDNVGSRNGTFTTTQVQLIRSYEILKKVYDELNLAEQEPFKSAVGIDPLQILQDAVSAEPIPKTTLMTISYCSKDPEQAVRLANAYAKIYIDSFADRQKAVSGEGLTKLKNQLEAMRQDREIARRDLLAYKEKYKLINIEDAYRLYQEQYNNFHTSLLEAKALDSQLRSTLTAIRNNPKSRILLLPSLNEHSNIPQIQMLMLQHLITRPQKISPADIALHDQTTRALSQALDNTLASDEQNLVMQIAQNQKRIELLKEELENVNKSVTQIDKVNEGYSQLEDIYKVAEDVYRSLAKRIREVTIADATDHLEGRGIYITTPAIKAIVVYPRKVLICALALILGLGLAGGSSLLLGLLNNSIKTRDDVKMIFGNTFPDFGSVPKVEVEEQLIFSDTDPHSSLIEDFRLIRSNLNLSLSTRNQTVFLTSSTVPGEGKTFTTINLAKTFALEGKKVLMIDLDLRRPRVYAVLSSFVPNVNKNDKGISNVLVNDASLSEVVHNVQGLNFDVAFCGPTPPNATELLNKEIITAMIEEARKSYDIILLDSPPLLSLPDTRVLASFGFPLLLIVRLFKVTQPQLRRLADDLSALEIKLSGFITNCADTPDKSYRYYNYYYRNHYYSYSSQQEQ